MSCDIPVDGFQREVGTLDVSAKYIQLMQDSMSEDSLYIRAKDTFKVIFDDLQITEKEKAQIVSEYISTMTTSLSSVAMQTALQWTKEERDGAYTLAKVKADTEVALANAAKTKEEICLVTKQTELQCANILATVSGSYRENGKPTAYAQDGCTPTGLDDTGLKYHQTKQVEAAAYQTFADAFRKSGVVMLGTDEDDQVYKGLSGDVGEITSGYTRQQTLNAERQRVAYEDAKRNHAVNASATMMGQMYAIDEDADNEVKAIFKNSLEYLNNDREDY